MNNIDYNEVLCAKVQAEYNAFYEKLEGMTPKEIISHAYEKVIKEDLVLAIENGCLTQAEATVLCLEEHPLDFIYQEWMDSDYSYMDMLRDTIEDAARKASKKYA